MEVTLNNFDNKKILYIFIGASILLHLCLSIVYVQENTRFFSSETKPVEQEVKIRFVSTEESRAKQIAQTENSKLNELNKPKFLSNKNNSFERETKSANNGKFQAAGKGVRTAVAKRDLEVAKKINKKKVKNLKFSDFAFKAEDQVVVKKIKKVARINATKKGLKNGKKRGIGLGQTNDFLEEIPLGDFTRLNTQEYEYYGFYHRVRQKLEQFWGLNIQDKADKIYKQGRSIASESNLITGLTIKLNNQGEIIDIMVKSTSGVKELDDAAIESFNQAGPFPNPPKGMLRKGKATIEWGFVVNT